MYKFVVLLILGLCTLSVHGINQTEVSKRIDSLSQKLMSEYQQARKDIDIISENLNFVTEQVRNNGNLMIVGSVLRQRYNIRKLENEALMKNFNISSCIVPNKAIYEEFVAVSSLQVGECTGKFSERVVSLSTLTFGILEDILEGPRTLADILTNCPFTYKDDPKCVDKIYAQLLIHEAGTLEKFRSVYNNFAWKVQAISRRMGMCGDKEVELVESVGAEMVQDIEVCIQRLKKE